MPEPSPAGEALVAIDGPVAVPEAYVLGAKERFQPNVVSATFDGSGAAGAFLPCCSLYSQNGKLISRTFPAQVSAGDVAEVTYGPFLQVPSAAGGGVISPPSPVAGYDAYVAFLAGSSGVWIPPVSGKLLVVVCVGAGGGGGGGGRSAAAGTQASGGGGGGGGAVNLAWLDVARMNTLYPTGIPYSVALGGAGGLGAVTGGAAGGTGHDALATTFGLMSAGGGGGGGGGAGTTGLSGAVGGGGGILSASGSTPGQPAAASGVFGLWTMGGSRGADYGGGAGGGAEGGGAGAWFGGTGGGGGGRYSTNASIIKGAAPGPSGSYSTGATGGSNGEAGQFTGMWNGTGGAGGQGANSLGSLPGNGGNAYIGGGGGGAGGGFASAAGNGGKGGDGLIFVYVFG